MQRKLPGIDIPAATEAKILHAAAFLEFKSHVERLAREGSEMLQHTHAGCMALKCCIPPTSSRLGQIQSFPPPAEATLLP